MTRGNFHERVGETPVHWQFLYSRLHGLLKLIFHSNQYNGAYLQQKNIMERYDVHFVFLQTGPRCRFQREAILNMHPAGISSMQVFLHSINFFLRFIFIIFLILNMHLAGISSMQVFMHSINFY